MSDEPPVSPQTYDDDVSDEGEPQRVVEEDATDMYQVEIEEAVTQFQAEALIRHNQCPDSDSDSEYVPLVPMKRNHTIQRRGDGSLHLKKTFSSGVGFKEAVLDYALSTGYNIKQYRYDLMKLGYKCNSLTSTGKCQWRVYCSINKRKNIWEIKVYKDQHSCTSRNGVCEMLTDPIIARLFVDKMRKDPNYYMPLKIQQVIREQFKGIVATRNQCQEARIKALKWIKQEYEDQFAHIRGYCQEILESNPGSTVDLQTINGPTGDDMFDRFYVCFAALKNPGIDLADHLLDWMEPFLEAL